jgi:hypothetical protein
MDSLAYGAAEAQLMPPNNGHASDEFPATKGGRKFSRRGRPKNPLITRLMAEGVSQRTAFRRLAAKRKAWAAKAARMGSAQDPRNQHPDGYHPTPPRGVRALLARESFGGVLWECACGDGAISRILEAEGFEVISTDLVDRDYGRGGHDFLADNATLADHIITNPPYGPARARITPRSPITSSPTRPTARRVGWPRGLSSTRSLVSGPEARSVSCCGQIGRPLRRTGS